VVQFRQNLWQPYVVGLSASVVVQFRQNLWQPYVVARSEGT